MEKKKIRPVAVIGYILLSIFVLLGFVLLFVSRWAFATWEVLTLDEIVYHMGQSLDGTNPDMIKDLIFHYIIWGVLCAAMVIAAAVFVRRYGKKARIISVTAAALIAAGLIGYVVYDADKRLGVISYVTSELQGESGEDYVKDNYVNPAKTSIEFPEKKRNLIYIFLESMEMTYADEANGGAFGDRNCIEALEKVAYENDCFNGGSGKLNGGISLPGSTWTMGGMFGQSTGLPLKVPVQGNKVGKQGEFFKSVTGLGDILKKEGYQQTLMIGSEVHFGGRDLYYEQHGNFEICDYDWALKEGKIPADYKVFWGYEDEKLYSFAREKLLDMDKSGEPFNLTLLTVDTHFEDGYKCRLCKDKFGDDQYANAMDCAANQLADFLGWIKEQDFYENTTIIINGDHPTMDKDFCKDVSADYQRKTYTCIVNSAKEIADPSKVREFSTYDLFPTTLSAMGCTIEGDRLGLGTDLYSGSQTLIERDGLEKVSAELEKPSAFMNKLSNITINESIMKKMAKQTSVYPKENKNGELTFIVDKVAQQLNIDSVEKIVLRLEDTETKEKYEFEMDIEQVEGNANKFTAKARTNIKADRKDHLKGNAYVWAPGFPEYKIGKYVTEKPN